MAAIIKIDDDTGKVLEFMQREIPADRLAKVADAVQKAAKLLWEERWPDVHRCFVLTTAKLYGLRLPPDANEQDRGCTSTPASGLGK